MRINSSHLSRNNIAICFIAVNFIGLFTSRILMSNGMIWFFALALIPNSLFQALQFRPTSPQTTFERLTGVFRYPPFYTQMSLVIVALFGCLNSSELPYAYRVLFTYSPFLFMPIAFGAIQPFSKKQFIAVLYLYNAIVFIAATVILANYFMHYDAINLGLKQGIAIPTPYREHIRFSLMICFSICSLIYLRINNYYLWTEKSEKIIQYFLATIMTVFLHILSVRSGILSLYICFLAIAIFLIINNKKYVLGGLFILFTFLAPVVSYYTFPSLKNKINYMVWDLQQIRDNNARNYSDAERLVSIMAGIKVAKTNPFFGVGTGDIKTEMNIVYEKEYPWVEVNNRKMPHNQWVWLWASNGILGIIALLISIVLSLLYDRNYKNLLLICFFIISISSFLYEHTLQIQVGVAFYVLCLLIILNYLRGKENVDENRI